MKKNLILIYLGFFLTVFVFAQADLQPAATVSLTKSEAITVKQLRTEVERIEKSLGRTLTEKERRDVLDSMVNEKLVQQAAERDKINVTDNEVETQIREMRALLSQNIGHPASDSELAQAVKAEYNLEMAAFRTELRKMLTNQKYLMVKKEKQMQTEAAAVKEPTEADITKFLEDNQTTLFMRPQTVKISAIQVPFGADRTKAKDSIDRIAKDIGSNSDKFNETTLRGKLSSSAYNAAEDIYLPRDDRGRAAFGNEFVDIAFRLKRGEISGVITGRDGFYLIKADTIFPTAMLGPDDILQLGVPVTVREYILNIMGQQIQQRILTKATEELITELRTGRTFQIFEKNLIW
jgi:parvulin-like peptidyl-prolyl isomerase